MSRRLSVIEQTWKEGSPYRAHGIRRGIGGHLDRPRTGHRTRSRAGRMAHSPAEPRSAQHQSNL